MDSEPPGLGAVVQIEHPVRPEGQAPDGAQLIRLHALGGAEAGVCGGVVGPRRPAAAADLGDDALRQHRGRREPCGVAGEGPEAGLAGVQLALPGHRPDLWRAGQRAGDVHQPAEALAFTVREEHRRQLPVRPGERLADPGEPPKIVGQPLRELGFEQGNLLQRRGQGERTAIHGPTVPLTDLSRIGCTGGAQAARASGYSIFIPLFKTFFSAGRVRLLRGLDRGLLPLLGTQETPMCIPPHSVDLSLLNWLHRPLQDAPADLDVAELIETLGPTIRAYHAWLSAGGLESLNAYARRCAGSDPDRGSDAATETYLDVHDRIENAVSRAVAGRSVPSWSNTAAVTRYHRLQVQLRLRGRWSRRRAFVSTDDVILPVDETVTRVLDVRRHALPLWFAVRWTMADVCANTDKPAGWWWQMLRHGLGLEKVSELGGARNDPGEAVARLRARLAVAVALRPQLERWAAEHPLWSVPGTVSLEEPPAPHEIASVSRLLPQLRAALSAGLDAVPMSPAESQAMARILVRGSTARTQLGKLDGADSGARVARLLGLSVDIGAAALQRWGAGGAACGPAAPPGRKAA